MRPPEPRLAFVIGVSRSGTTLLSAALDAHPDVVMGYELIAPASLRPTWTADLIEADPGSWEPWPRAIGNQLRDLGHPLVGQFVKRTARIGATPRSLVRTLRNVALQHGEDLSDLDARIHLAFELCTDRAREMGTKWCGFKVPPDHVSMVMERRPDSRAIAIVRDPRDVFTSARLAGMDTDPAVSARRWVAHVHAVAALPVASVLTVRYEDLVSERRATLERLAHHLELEYSPRMASFESEELGVFAPNQRHANHDALSRGFFTDSIGRWRSDLDPVDSDRIVAFCELEMRAFGYQWEPGSLSPARWRPHAE